MSYPYGGGGGGGGYPGQGQGGYPAAPGYPQAGGGYPQQGYGAPPQPGVGMPTPESASAAGYGSQPGGMPYGTAPPGGAPGQAGFGMPGAPQQGYPQAPGISMPAAPGAGQPTYQQNMGYGQNPAYNTQAPQPGYNSAGAPGYPAPGGAPGYPGPGGAPQGGYAGGAPPGGYAGGAPPGGYAGGAPPGGPGGAPGYQQPGSAPGQAPAGYGGYGQGQTGAPASAPGGMAYAGNVSQGHNVQAMGQGGSHTGYKVREDATLKSSMNFSAENDAKVLRKAMKGFGTDEKAIIDILAYRTNSQRQQIKQMFKTCFGKDLIQDLKSELGGHFEDVVLALMMRTDEYDAYELKRAMRGIGTDEDAMIEILCSRSNAQIQAINQTYHSMYRQKLEKDISSDTSGHFKRLMISMANGGRQENQNVDMNKANTDAQSLFQAGEKRLGTDESQFNITLASQSFEQLRAVFDAYSRISGRDIEQVVRGEMSGNLEIGMVAIVKCVRNKPAYFAEKLYRSMKGAGTDDRTLIRCIVTRAEVDMVQIKQEFQKMYHQSLEQFIQSDISGDYRRVMLGMVAGGY